jgi:hypothetical protein
MERCPHEAGTWRKTSLQRSIPECPENTLVFLDAVDTRGQSTGSFNTIATRILKKSRTTSLQNEVSRRTNLKASMHIVIGAVDPLPVTMEVS